MKFFATLALFALTLFVSVPVAAQDHGAAPAAAAHAEGQAAAGEGHAAAGEGHAEEKNPNEIWWKWLNFAILAGGIGFLLKKHAGPYFAARTEEIQAGIADAAKVKADAEARAAELERKVSHLSEEVAGLREKSKHEIEREGERVRAETEASIKKIQAQAEAEIASAAKHASHDLKAYSARLALELAERQIRDRMSDQVQDQLADTFVGELRGKAVNN